MKNQHKFYLEIALLAAQQSYCKRSQVGAVIVNDNNILSFGYNGTPSGFCNNCEEINPDANLDNLPMGTTYAEQFAIGYRTRTEVLHAESNAILKCAKSGRPTAGATLYLTISPCVECCKLIIQSGIKTVIYRNEYRDITGLSLLERAGVVVEKYTW